MNGELRYIEAGKVENVGRLPVRLDASDDGERSDREVGDLDGLIVDPAARRVRYFVIEASGSKYLLPLCPTRLDSDENALCVIAPQELHDWQQFNPGEFPQFEDSDVLSFMFAKAH